MTTMAINDSISAKPFWRLLEEVHVREVITLTGIAGDILGRNDAYAPAGTHAQTACARVGGGLVQRNQAESNERAIYQAPPIELNGCAASGTRYLNPRGCGNTLQQCVASIAGAVVPYVMANDPAAVPVGVARRAGAAVGVVRDFLNDNLSPTLDGFRSGVKQAGLKALCGLPHAPSLYQWCKTRRGQCSEQSYDGHHNHQFNGCKTMLAGCRFSGRCLTMGLMHYGQRLHGDILGVLREMRLGRADEWQVGADKR